MTKYFPYIYVCFKSESSVQAHTIQSLPWCMSERHVIDAGMLARLTRSESDVEESGHTDDK